MSLVLISIEDCEWTWKDLSSFFDQIKFIVFKEVWFKNILLSFSATSFFYRYIPYGKFW